jgi:hypothetical protein
VPDYRTLYDDKWIRAWDLGGKPWTGTIVKVEAGILEDARRGKKDRKPVVWFKGWSKPLALNRTNGKSVASMYGNRTEDWVGKKVTLVPAKTDFGAERNIDCIRIRPGRPTAKEDQPVPVVAPPPEELQAAPPPSEEEAPVCRDAKCGTCALCLEAADNERRAQEAS